MPSVPTARVLRTVAVPFPTAAATAAARDIRALGYTDISVREEGDTVVLSGPGVTPVRFTPLRQAGRSRAPGRRAFLPVVPMPLPVDLASA